MPRSRSAIALCLTVTAALIASARLALRADDPKAAGRAASTSNPPGAARTSIQDALLRAEPLPFGEETALADVAAELRRLLGTPVVLDRAAMGRLDLSDDSKVRLEPMPGVRVKTALKLLLEPVGLVAHAVPEDNLLILTDTQGAGDRTDFILQEVKSMHHEIHTLQDTLDQLFEDLAPAADDGPRLRKPTIIEDVPEDGAPENRPGKEPAETKPRTGRRSS